MSQMGQKRKSSERADVVRFTTRKRTKSRRLDLSALCHNRTHAVQQTRSRSTEREREPGQDSQIDDGVTNRL